MNKHEKKVLQYFHIIKSKQIYNFPNFDEMKILKYIKDLIFGI